MKSPAFACAMTLLAAVGCDDQTQGPRPLLSVHGSAQLPTSADAANPHAAIVFLSTEQNALHIIDPETEPQAPERFRLELWDEPPSDAIAEFIDPNGKANTLAVGYIGAVTADHPEFAPRIGQRFESTGYICDPDDREQCECPEQGCDRRVRVCIDDSDDCFEQTWLCPGIRSPNELCEEQGSIGDPAIARQPWVSVYGVSQNYMILYAKLPVPADSFLAAALGSQQRLPAGYHLIEVRDMTEEERSDAAACRLRAEQRAAEQYNQKNVTSFDADQLKVATCPVPGFCRSDIFAQYVTAALFEIGCPLSDRVMKSVSPHAAAPITVDLKPELWSPLTPP